MIVSLCITQSKMLTSPKRTNAKKNFDILKSNSFCGNQSKSLGYNSNNVFLSRICIREEWNINTYKEACTVQPLCIIAYISEHPTEMYIVIFRYRLK